MHWEEVAFVSANKIRLKIMDTLSSGRPFTPKELAKSSDVALSNVSTKLIELKKRDLIVCLNPKAKKFRLYTLTQKGKKVLGEAKPLSR